MQLARKKVLAAKVLKVGKGRIVFDKVNSINQSYIKLYKHKNTIRK